MLSSFRRAHRSWIVGGLLGLVMLAFIITGLSTRSGDVGAVAGPDSAATVGDDAVTLAELRSQVERQLAQVRQEQPDIDMPRFIGMGGFDQILTQLITSKAMKVFGLDQGLAASKQMIDGEIASIPAFHNAAGKFDDTTFRQALDGAKINEKELREDILTQLIQRQLLLPIAASPKIPEGMAHQYASLLLEARTGNIGAVSAQAVGAGPPPSEAEIAAYFREKQSRYMIPERRTIRYATFGAPDVAPAARASDADIANYYKSHAAEYAPSETRRVAQVVLPDQNAANAFVAKLKSGKSFDQAADEAGFTTKDTELGTFNKADLTRQFSDAVANAAFAAPQGGVTAPIRSPLGWHVVRVLAVNAIPGRPLAQVQGEIRARLEAEKTTQLLGDMVNDIEDKITDGASFADIAKEYKLVPTETPPVTGAGAAPDTPGYQLPAELNALLKSASELSGEDDPVVETIAPNSRYAILQVTRVIAAAPPPLDRVKDRVRADLIAERAATRAKAIADRLAAEINRGTPIREAFGKAGVALPPVQTVNATRMQLAQAGGQVPEPLRMVFSLPKGKAKVVRGPGGSWFVVHVEQVVAGNAANAPGLVQATRSQFSSVVGPELAEQFSRAAEREVKTHRHEANITQLRNELKSTGSVLAD